jgi:hypothetical protein
VKPTGSFAVNLNNPGKISGVKKTARSDKNSGLAAHEVINSQQEIAGD